LGIQVRPVSAQEKPLKDKPYLSAAFIMVGDTGIEPVTSCMSSNEGSFQN